MAEEKLQAGKRQLSSGINQLNAGKSKLALGEAVKVILILIIYYIKARRI